MEKIYAIILLLFTGQSAAHSFLVGVVYESPQMKGCIEMNILEQITQEQIRTDLPKFNIGDTLRIYVKVTEGSRERIQMFEGTVIKKNHGGIQETFTVRRVSYGVGVERTFPMNSPKVERIEVVRRGKVRRAKLYYLRDRVGKAAKVKEKIQ